MTQTSRTLFQRIRCIKSSLDNAEQSFMDNKDIRGELDLMLAEAELKNLRRKKDRPWSWNRQVLAGCAAMLLVLAGFGGWYCAKDHYRAKSKEAVSAALQTAAVKVPQRTDRSAASVKNVAEQQPSPKVHNDIPVQEKQATADRVNISKADMHRLVQSARVELSSSK